MKTKNNKPSVAYVMGFMGISGGNRIIYEHANRLADRGLDVKLLHLNDGKDRGWKKINPKVNVIPFSETDKWINDTDIIIATFNETFWNIIDLPSKIKKAYFVQSDERRFYEKGSLGEYLSNATYSFKDVHYFTSAKWMQDWLKESYSTKAELILNMIEKEEFYPDPDPKLKSDKKIVLVEGSLDTKLKGVKDAVEAIKDIDCEKWLFTCSIPKYPQYTKIFDKIFSRPDTKRIRQIYSSADILVKPSKFESVSLPNMEAMCCKCAVISTNTIGVLSYSKNLENSILVDVGDIKDFREAVKDLINDDTLREKLIENGLIYAQENFYKWDEEIEKLEKYFNDIKNNDTRLSPKRKSTRKNLEKAYYISRGHYQTKGQRLKEKLKKIVKRS